MILTETRLDTRLDLSCWCGKTESNDLHLRHLPAWMVEVLVLSADKVIVSYLDSAVIDLSGFRSVLYLIQPPGLKDIAVCSSQHGCERPMVPP